MITNPNLPPKKGYVEVEIDGRRTYRNISTGALIEEEMANTPAQLREQAYNSEHVIEWEGEQLTVTEAARLWMFYASENSGKADELTALIVDAKLDIRAKYPDTEE
jgi:hypothetical protein